MSTRQVKIDGAKIRRIRLACGLSERALANQLSTSTTVIRGIERGTNLSSMRLGSLWRLAEILELHPTELLYTATPDAPVARSPDARTIEAALMVLARRATIHEIAAALDWDVSRARDALNDLTDVLAGTGSAVHIDGWAKVRLVPNTTLLNEQQVTNCRRREHNRAAYTATSARVLYLAAHDQLTARSLASLSPGELAAFQSLLRQRLIEPTDQNVFALTDDARYGMALTLADTTRTGIRPAPRRSA